MNLNKIVFKQKVKCLKGYKSFKKNGTYLVTAFSSDKLWFKRLDALESNEFPVYKETANELVDKQILK